ncbi:MAG: helix-turn-helix transcriptional regulator [Rhodospirillales bacterium]|jgi:transcriptional regulator with XRE-family HTH domain|nr:helix-turn-helix transcriptional regulator [Rhodospirillales bacterium]
MSASEINQSASTGANTDDDTNDDSLSSIPVGDQIRDLRKAQNLTITDLAEKLGRSVGYISQIERNISPVAIDRLKEIAEAMGVQISWFFQGRTEGPEEERDMIVRRGNRRHLTFTGSGLREELLSPNLSGDFEMIMTTYEPQATTGEELYARPCQEAALVIEGRLQVWIGERTFILEEGDTMTFNGLEPHSSANPDDTPARVVWVMSPPTY